MKVKGIFTSISGSLGGVVGSHNKGGQYLRARTVPVNPNTSGQQRARTDLTVAVAEYGTTSEFIRQGWRNYAEQQAWTNSQGDAIQLSGQQAFVGVNSIQALLGNPFIVTPPPPNTRPGAPQMTVVADNLTPSGEIAVTWDNATGDAGDSLLVYVGRIVGPGVQFYKTPYKFIGTLAGDTVAAENLPLDFLYAVGNRIPVRGRTVKADGSYSAFTEFIIEATS